MGGLLATFAWLGPWGIVTSLAAVFFIHGAIGAIAVSHGFAGAFTMGGVFTIVVGGILLLMAIRTR